MFASVCRHCDEVNLPSVTLLINRDGLNCCLTYSAATLRSHSPHGDFSPCPPTVSTLDRFSGRDHGVVNVKAHESLGFATNVPSHQTWFMSTTSPTQLLRVANE